MADFTHLHVHSHYSLLDGMGKIHPMLTQAKALGMDSIALTDHGSMYGVIDLIKTAKEVGIKPIIGFEAYLAPQGHLNKRGRVDANPRHVTLLAQNNAGYKNLIKLTTEAHLHGYYYKPRIDYELLEKHSEGLVVLSGCLNSDLSKAILEHRPADAARIIEWHLTVFGRERYFLEVQDHPHLPEQKVVNEALVGLGATYNVGLVATADTHYIHSDDAQAHDVLICVQTGTTVAETNRMSMLSDDFSLASPAALKEAWKQHPAAIDNTQRIAEMCSVELEFGVNRLPRFPLPASTSPDQYLREKCLEGLQVRYGAALPDEAHTRLDYELDVIKKTGFASYFLIVADFVNEAKRRGILVGPGRGSAAGSFVSYLMNITNLDPLQYNLLFERFLNPDRVSMPDIDLDFADDRRDEVISYVREKYGNDHVAQIITFGTMAARAAVRDAGRALGFPYSFCDQVAKTVPLMSDFNEALQPGSELKNLYDSDPQARKLIDTARRLEGVCRHASTHAAGVVITDEPLTEYLPLQLASRGGKDAKEDTVTQFPMNDVEALGLLKVDFLGLKNLTIIQNTLDRIKARFGREIALDTLPLNDAPAYKLLQEGKSTGVFQLESAGMKRYLKELKPTEFEDIISMVALYRPGPMDSIPDFIAAKHGKRKITYLHPLLMPILEKTYGVIVTQDQVLQIAREFAGFTYAQADILRKAVGKKIKKLLDEQREKFIQGAISAKSIDPKTARAVWDFIEPFARYGFNRAHAACYAMIAYQTAYLKAHYPADFMAALLTSDEGNIDRAAIEVAEAIQMGLSILAPDVNESDHTFTVVPGEEGDSIRFGLSATKNVGHGVVEAIIAERRANGIFTDLAAFFSRVDSKDLNRKSVESLARAGAFDGIAERQHILTNVEKLLDFNRSLHKKQDKGQRGLFGDSTAAPAARLVLEETPAASKEDRLKWEKELLGMFVSEHPLTQWQQDLVRVVTPVSELTTANANQRVRVAGVCSKINKIITKSNQPMLFVELEDLTGSLEVLVFPGTLHETSDMWQEGASLIVEGKISDKDGEPKILTDKVWRLTRDTLALFKSAPSLGGSAPRQSISLFIPVSFSRDQLQQLRETLRTHHKGSGLPVELIVQNGGSRTRLSTDFKLEPNEAGLEPIRHLVGGTSVRVR
jgi:DNA polymerase III subunit alpha